MNNNKDYIVENCLELLSAMVVQLTNKPKLLVNETLEQVKKDRYECITKDNGLIDNWCFAMGYNYKKVRDILITKNENMK